MIEPIIKCLRAGAWNCVPGLLRAALRLNFTLSYRDYDHGFRLVVRIKDE